MSAAAPSKWKNAKVAARSGKTEIINNADASIGIVD